MERVLVRVKTEPRYSTLATGALEWWNGDRAMSIAVWVEQQDGMFTALVPGIAQLCATADTRESAIVEVRKLIDISIRSGDLVLIEPPRLQSPPIRRTWTKEEQEDLDEMVTEIYRLRAEEKAVRLAELDRTPEDWQNQRHPCTRLRQLSSAPGNVLINRG